VRQVVCLILAGGQGAGLGVLTSHRPASAMPFGGKYRVIDFCLSNCANSEIIRVAVLTQYAPVSLNDHIATGATWDLDRRDLGVKLLQAYGRRQEALWYRGTADAIGQNLNVLENWGARWVIVCSADQVYKMDYAELVRDHVESGCPVTMTVKHVPEWDRTRFGIVSVDAAGRVVDIEEKPAAPRGNLANLGIYVFDARFLFERMSPGMEAKDLVLDLILPLVREGRSVHGHVFDGYWDDIGAIDAYFRANMELLATRPRLVLADPDWRIFTPSEERPPVKVARGAEVTRSLVANGAVVHGRVIDSILFPGAIVEEGATVVSSIIFQDAVIARGAGVDLAILDKRVQVGAGALVGHGATTHAESGTLGSSIVVAGKNATIPAAARIGRGTAIDVGVRGEDFPELDLPAGSRVTAGVARAASAARPGG
jgi:glucose-1-phosphate adenylyltransferase